jgi:hypothetical protein
VVDDGRVRRLERRTRQLGFPELHSYLQARCDSGYSVPGLARELGESEWTVTQVLATLGVVLPPRPQRLAQQRRLHAEERIAGRVVELGFAGIGAYLEDRLTGQEWLLVEVAAELGAHRATVRRLMAKAGVVRVQRTARQVAAGGRGRQVQSVGWEARRAARLAELGFGDLAAYLGTRYVVQGWPIKRMRAELQVGRNWLVDQMARLGLR